MKFKLDKVDTDVQDIENKVDTIVETRISLQTEFEKNKTVTRVGFQEQSLHQYQVLHLVCIDSTNSNGNQSFENVPKASTIVLFRSIDEQK